MKQLKIAHINTSSSGGGAAGVARTLATAQIVRGHTANIFCNQYDKNDQHSIFIPTERPIILANKCKSEGLLNYDIQGSHKIIDHPVLQNADLINFHNLHGDYFNPFSLSALSNYKPSVWTLHDMQALTGHCAHSMDCKRYVTGCNKCEHLNIPPQIVKDSANTLWKHKRDIYQHSILNIVTPSEWLAKRVRSSILSEHPLEVIYNGICTNTFKPHDKKLIRRQLGLDENAMIIGSVSHFGVLDNPWKGGDILLAALQEIWSKFPNTYFLNIGGNSDIEDQRILSTGHIKEQEQLAMALSVLDIFIYSSRADNCPLVILEAMSVGLPIVSSATGGIPELLDSGRTGLVTRYKDVTDLAGNTIKLMEDLELQVKLGKAARAEAVDKFGLDLMFEKYDKFYCSAIEHFERKKNGSESLTFLITQVPEEIRTRPFLNSIVDDENQNWNELKNSAFKLFENQNIEECEKQLNIILKEDPSDHEMVTLMALILIEKNEPNIAEQLLLTALNLNAENVVAYDALMSLRENINSTSIGKI